MLTFKICTSLGLLAKGALRHSNVTSEPLRNRITPLKSIMKVGSVGLGGPNSIKWPLSGSLNVLSVNYFVPLRSHWSFSVVISAGKEAGSWMRHILKVVAHTTFQNVLIIPVSLQYFLSHLLGLSVFTLANLCQGSCASKRLVSLWDMGESNTATRILFVYFPLHVILLLCIGASVTALPGHRKSKRAQQF